MTRKTPIALATPVQAQSSKDVEELPNEPETLRAEVERLKEAGAWS